MIYQSEAAECGLASIAMVANHYGHKIDLSTLRSRYNVSFKGANLQQLMQLAEQLNMVGRALKLELDELKNLKTPCILHWDMNHFVVLKKVSRQSITILDPAVGERVVPMTEVDTSFTGIALELTPTSEFKKKDERAKLGITAFWTRIDGLKLSLVKLFVLSLILQLLMLAAPYYTQTVVDEVLVISPETAGASGARERGSGREVDSSRRRSRATRIAPAAPRRRRGRVGVMESEAPILVHWGSRQRRPFR